MRVLSKVARICAQELDARALRVALLDEIRVAIPFDSYVWLLTDPETCVGASPVADVPSLADIPKIIRLKYLTPVNRWTSMHAAECTTLTAATGGNRASSPFWNELLCDYGIDDVASMVFRDQYGCWSFLDLWRRSGSFSTDECAALSELSDTVTRSLRHSLLDTFAQDSTVTDGAGGPAVLLLSSGLDLLTQTPHSDAYLRTLLPTQADRVPVPAAAYNVGAQLLAGEHGVDTHAASARVHLRDGLWLTLRAARIKPTASTEDSIAVTIEPTPPHERADLYSRVIGLSEREADLLRHLVGGNDTREIGRRMFVSEHTVQDHLKSIFAKAGVSNRKLLVARATGAAGGPIPGRSADGYR